MAHTAFGSAIPWDQMQKPPRTCAGKVTLPLGVHFPPDPPCVSKQSVSFLSQYFRSFFFIFFFFFFWNKTRTGLGDFTQANPAFAPYNRTHGVRRLWGAERYCEFSRACSRVLFNLVVWVRMAWGVADGVDGVTIHARRLRRVAWGHDAITAPTMAKRPPPPHVAPRFTPYEWLNTPIASIADIWDKMGRTCPAFLFV